jgi:hypothetical protein
MDVVRSSPPLGSGGYLTSVQTVWQKAPRSQHRQMVDRFLLVFLCGEAPAILTAATLGQWCRFLAPDALGALPRRSTLGDTGN